MVAYERPAHIGRSERITPYTVLPGPYRGAKLR